MTLYLAAIVVAGAALGIVAEAIERATERRWFAAALNSLAVFGLAKLAFDVWRLS